VAATTRNFAQGTLQQSSSDFDLAIKGKGFFQITLPDGTTGYTRDGSFQVDANGQLVTRPASRCSRASPSRPTRRRSPSRADGTVNVTLQGQATPAAVGQITAGQLHQPGRPGAARAEPVCRKRVVGRAAGGRTRHQRPGQLQQGMVEGSNVNVVEELVAMIATQRAYELNSKAIQTSDQMLQKLGQL
jgi:flagellar basal-body rod protein FlgG